MSKDVDIIALRAFLDQPDTVLFVGSGISLWSGLPNWPTLIRHLIDVAHTKGSRTRIAQDAFANGQLLDAADALSLTQSEISEAIRMDLGFQSARPHEIHSLLTHLGPQRFVTTNYDTLIEQQLGLEGRLGEFRTVTARQVAELADIVKASADRFIFKPHGDIADAESSVLSARDYERVILGERNLIRSALEILLVTRPVLFLGYGLRDPDTALVLRTLRDRYLGSVAHYAAIVADVSDEERDYWWERYRIRLFSYSTQPGEGGARDHSAILSLLRDLVGDFDHDAARERDATAEEIPLHGTALLTIASTTHREIAQNALVRYAARLIQARPAVLFPLRAQLPPGKNPDWHKKEITRLHNRDVADVLALCPISFILQGKAGSGKTFSIANFLSRAARRILEWDESGAKKVDRPPVPILLDARLYSGNFQSLLDAVVPGELDIATLSQTHEIVVIVDSLDEMPIEHLDAAVWRSDLENLLGRLSQYRLILSTRRADLAGRPNLPVFSVGELTEDFVQNSLDEIGVKTNEISTEFLSELSVPFLLWLSRTIFPGSPNMESTRELLSNFINSKIADLFTKEDADQIRNKLSNLASTLISSGYETIGIDEAIHFISAEQQSTPTTVRANQHIIDRLVSAGLMVSEIDGHVRFVHRSLTEYLASSQISEKIRTDSLDVRSLLKTRRWDNSIAWSVPTLDENEAEAIISEIYAADPVLAHRIVASAEISTASLWRIFLRRVIDSPPSQNQMLEIARFQGDVTVPPAVTPEFRALVSKSGEELSGWAFAHYAPVASNKDLYPWIDRLRRGEVEFNTSNYAGHALGKRLTGELLEYFLNSLSKVKFGPIMNSDGTENHAEVALRFGFEAAIRALSKEILLVVLKWARRQPDPIRGLICSAIRDKHEPEVYRFLLSQLDRGLNEVIFDLFLRVRYGEDRGKSAWVPRFTERRFNIVLKMLDGDNTSDRTWVISFLRACAEQDRRWKDALTAKATGRSRTSIDKAVKLIHPDTSATFIESYISRALANPKSVSKIERFSLSAIQDRELAIREADVLQSMRRYGREGIFLILDFFQDIASYHCVEVSSDRIDDWIGHLTDLFPRSSWTDVPLPFALTGYLGTAWSTKGRDLLLGRANDPADPARDFILCFIIPHLRGITTTDLTDEAARRLLKLYFDGTVHLWPSPGAIATEEFIVDIVFPLAKTLGDDPHKRTLIEQVLYDAGQRLDRRYQAPWKSDSCVEQ